MTKNVEVSHVSHKISISKRKAYAIVISMEQNSEKGGIATIKSKRTILEIVGGTLCLTLGILGGRVTMAIAHNSTQSTQIEAAGQLAAGKQAAKIAVVNLDAGIEKNNQQIYYASKIIEYPNENYQTTSLEEAKTGIENGQYGAYVIIPSTFSASVDSINGIPEKAVFEYQLSSNLSAEEREKIIYEVSEFEKSISTNVSYIYVDAILSEVHSVQDGASTILANDDSEKKSLLSVSAEALIEPVEFSEMKEKNDTVKPIDLQAESLNLQNAVRKIETDFDGWLNEGQKDYAVVVSKNQDLQQSLESLEKSMESTNPLLDEQGKYNIAEGISSVNAQIDAYNAMIAGKRQLLNDSIVNEINIYAQQNQTAIGTWKQEVQKKMQASVAAELQTQLNEGLALADEANKTFANQQSRQIENQVTEYVAELQSYLNTAITSETAKETVKNIAQSKAREAVDAAKTSYIEYGKNCAQRETIESYNQLLTENNGKAGELQEALGKFKEAENALAESRGISVEELYAGEKSPEETAYQETFATVIEKAEAIQGIELSDEPEELPEPEILVSIDREELDMKPLQDMLDLSKAVDGENQEIKQPEVTVSVPTPNIQLTPEAVRYQVPEFQMSQVSPVKEETLKEVEEYYDIPKDKVADTFEEKVVQVIEDRNRELQTDVLEKINLFSGNQGRYQSQLDRFDPFGYVDSSRIADNISAISENIAGIETEMNDRGTEYLQYTADVFTMANENINLLKEDMMKANEETKRKVTEQISSLKDTRSSTNQVNASILENFSKKLSFTRVGDLPYREAYEFIINPIEYKQSDK